MSDTKNIDLKTDILYENSDTYVSVTDLYNVNIFTNEFMEMFKEKENMQNRYYENIGQTVFLDEKQEEDMEVPKALFLEKMDLSKKQDVSDKQSDSMVGQLLIGLIIFVVFILSMIQYSLRRAVRRKKYADKDNICVDAKQN